MMIARPSFAHVRASVRAPCFDHESNGHGPGLVSSRLVGLVVWLVGCLVGWLMRSL
jgi:hypothetical protein